MSNKRYLVRKSEFSQVDHSQYYIWDDLRKEVVVRVYVGGKRLVQKIKQLLENKNGR